MGISPYTNQPIEKWETITKGLIAKHPLEIKTLVNSCHEAWNDIFNSEIGTEKFKIGKDIFPKPQIMGFFLHELIALKLTARFPKAWKRDDQIDEKDLVYTDNLKYSIEIKTSSHKNKIFGNRSYGQEQRKGKKEKKGYYLAINFEKFSTSKNPKILLIRFGWLDHSDWIPQKAPTGQQSRLTLDAEKYKLIEIYPNTKRFNFS